MRTNTRQDRQCQTEWVRQMDEACCGEEEGKDSLLWGRTGGGRGELLEETETEQFWEESEEQRQGGERFQIEGSGLPQFPHL